MTLHGVDVSHYQAGLSLSGADFAIFKATQGVSMVDHECDNFYQQARAKGILRGVYHFADGGDVAAEADHFLANVRGYIGDAILVLDWEGDAVHRGPSWAKGWLDRVTAWADVRPLIYMSQSVCNEYDWHAVAGDYALWVARYGSSIGSTGAWGSAAMWQYTDALAFNGAHVDGDTFYGDAGAWHAFAGSTEPAPPPPPAPDQEDDDMAGVLVKDATKGAGEPWWLVNAMGRRWVASTEEANTLIVIGAATAQKNNQPHGWSRAQIESFPPMPGYDLPTGWH